MLGTVVPNFSMCLDFVRDQKVSSHDLRCKPFFPPALSPPSPIADSTTWKRSLCNRLMIRKSAGPFWIRFRLACIWLTGIKKSFFGTPAPSASVDFFATKSWAGPVATKFWFALTSTPASFALPTLLFRRLSKMASTGKPIYIFIIAVATAFPSWFAPCRFAIPRAPSSAPPRASTCLTASFLTTAASIPRSPPVSRPSHALGQSDFLPDQTENISFHVRR